MRNTNRQWRLKRFPDGLPSEDDWALVEGAIPEPGEAEFLVRAIYLSVDPYMRGRISPQQNYAAGVGLDDVMQGGAVGEIVRSNHPDFAVGELVENIGFGWQDFAVLGAPGTTKVDPALGPISAYLSYLGMPGLTAYFGITEVGQVKPGDTVVISAASGAVGQVAGQVALALGGHPIAVAGTDEKLAWCRELGYEAGINHATTPDLVAALAETCPNGIDVYFDNTAGPIHDAVMQNLALNARIIICGLISQAATFGQPDIGARYLRNLLVARARMQGMLVFDWADRYETARAQLAAWAKAGTLRHREDVLVGIEHMPEAFLRLLTGRNFGKQLVQVAEPPAGAT